MSDTLRLTGGDLMRALGGLSPAVDRAARGQAEEVARLLRAEAGMATRVTRRGNGDYVVSIEGQGLFAREFGSLDEPADPVIAQAIAESKQ
jgi:hypothetical protein